MYPIPYTHCCFTNKTVWAFCDEEDHNVGTRKVRKKAQKQKNMIRSVAVFFSSAVLVPNAFCGFCTELRVRLELICSMPKHVYVNVSNGV